MKRFLALFAVGALLAIVPAAVSGASDEVFTGSLSGAQEVPAVTTSATGTVYLFVNTAGTEIKYAVSYSGLSGTLVAAHIQVGARGSNGTILFTLTPGPSTMFGSLTAANFQPSASAATWNDALAIVRSGKAYVNLHTAAHPNGEIRAQLAPSASGASPSAGATAAPSGHRSLPPTSTADPITPRPASADMTPLAVLALISLVGGILATWKVQPSRRRRDDASS